jgi:hypothetical protein
MHPDNNKQMGINANVIAKGGGDYSKSTAPDEDKQERCEGAKTYLVSLQYEEDILARSTEEALDIFITALTHDKQYCCELLAENTEVMEI